MSTAEKIFHKAKALPEGAQAEVLSLVEGLARETAAGGSGSPGALTLQETAELRGKLAAWEEDWNAPGMELYDRIASPRTCRRGCSRNGAFCALPTGGLVARQNPEEFRGSIPANCIVPSHRWR